MNITTWDTVFAFAFDYAVTKIELHTNKPLEKVGELNVNTFYNYMQLIK